MANLATPEPADGAVPPPGHTFHLPRPVAGILGAAVPLGLRALSPVAQSSSMGIHAAANLACPGPAGGTVPPPVHTVHLP